MSGRDRGAGVRVVRGETTGFAHTADLSSEGLLVASDAAAAAARGGGGGVRVAALTHQERPVRDGADDVIAPETVEKRRKVDLLQRADAAAREQGDAITSVTASYADAHRRIVVANSDGLLADDDRVRTRSHGPVRRDRRHRDADRIRGARPHDGLRALRLRSARAGRAHRGDACAEPARSGTRADRPHPGRLAQRCGRRAVPRSLRARSRGRPHL